MCQAAEVHSISCSLSLCLCLSVLLLHLSLHFSNPLIDHRLEKGGVLREQSKGVCVCLSVFLFVCVEVWRICKLMHTSITIHYTHTTPRRPTCADTHRAQTGVPCCNKMNSNVLIFSEDLCCPMASGFDLNSPGHKLVRVSSSARAQEQNNNKTSKQLKHVPSCSGLL